MTCLVEEILHRRLPVTSQCQWTFPELGVPNRDGDSHDAAGLAAAPTEARGHPASATQWYEPMKTGSPYLAGSAVTGPGTERAPSPKPRRFLRQSSRVSKDRSSPFRWRGGRLGRRGTVVVAVVALLVAGGATTAWAKRGSSAAASTVASTRLVTVGTGTISQAVAASGTVAPTTTSNLTFGSAGQVTAVNVTQGQKVQAGEQLAAISSASLTSQVAQAQATIASDEAKLSTDQTAAASAAQITADQASITVAQAQLTNPRPPWRGPPSPRRSPAPSPPASSSAPPVPAPAPAPILALARGRVPVLVPAPAPAPVDHQERHRAGAQDSPARAARPPPASRRARVVRRARPGRFR